MGSGKSRALHDDSVEAKQVEQLDIVVPAVFAFNLRKIIYRLPASRFLWYDLVTPEKKPQYLYLLGQLITLFTAPHKHSIFPYKEGSFFQKFGHACGKFLPFFENDVFSMLQLLPSDNFELVYNFNRKNDIWLNDQTAVKLEGAPVDLNDFIEPWLRDESRPRVLVLSVSVKNEVGHATVLVLKKSRDYSRWCVEYIYFNPHGTHEMTSSTFLQNLENRLNTMLPSNYYLKPVHVYCPLLQSSEQGGNCLQWTTMIICLFCTDVRVFYNAEREIATLAENPQLNILLFSLSMFLKLMTRHSRANAGEPATHLELSLVYFVSFYNLGKSLEEIKSDTQKLLQVTKNFNKFLYRILGEQVCKKATTKESCNTPCQWCELKCHPNVLVNLKPDYTCSVLNPKQILEKMFTLFFQLKTLLGKSTDQDQVHFQSQMSFKVPDTLEDYTTLGYLTDDQVSKIRAYEPQPSRKRKLDTEEDDERVTQRPKTKDSPESVMEEIYKEIANLNSIKNMYLHLEREQPFSDKQNDILQWIDTLPLQALELEYRNEDSSFQEKMDEYKNFLRYVKEEVAQNLENL